MTFFILLRNLWYLNWYPTAQITLFFVILFSSFFKPIKLWDSGFSIKRATFFFANFKAYLRCKLDGLHINTTSIFFLNAAVSLISFIFFFFKSNSGFFTIFSLLSSGLFLIFLFAKNLHFLTILL